MNTKQDLINYVCCATGAVAGVAILAGIHQIRRSINNKRLIKFAKQAQQERRDRLNNV